jgi:hypothetical protein
MSLERALKGSANSFEPEGKRVPIASSDKPVYCVQENWRQWKVC